MLLGRQVGCRGWYLQNSWVDSPYKPDIPVIPHLLASHPASCWSFPASGEVLSGCLLHLAAPWLLGQVEGWVPGPPGPCREGRAYIWHPFTAMHHRKQPSLDWALGHMPPAGRLSTNVEHWEASPRPFTKTSLLLLASRPRVAGGSPGLGIRQNTSGGA